MHLSHTDAFRIAACSFLAILSSSAVLVAAVATGHESLAAAQPVLLYCGLPLLLLLPADALYLRPRRFFLGTLWRMLAPLQPISFADFLLADFLTSLAKSVSDVERAVCSMVTGPVLAAAADTLAEFRCGSASWHIPMALALPYLIRLSQCIRRAVRPPRRRVFSLCAAHRVRRESKAHAINRTVILQKPPRQYLDNPAERAQLANAVKYASALPVIALSALKYHVPLSEWVSFYKPLWLLSSLLNSGLSFFWDVTMDWELDALRRLCLGPRYGAGGKAPGAAGAGLSSAAAAPAHPLLRRELLYGEPFVLLLHPRSIITTQVCQHRACDGLKTRLRRAVVSATCAHSPAIYPLPAACRPRGCVLLCPPHKLLPANQLDVQAVVAPAPQPADRVRGARGVRRAPRGPESRPCERFPAMQSDDDTIPFSLLLSHR